MKKVTMIEESLYEFAKRGRPRKGSKKPKAARTGIDATDKWDVPVDDEEMVDPDEFDVDTSDMETAEDIEIEEEEVFDDKLFKALSNEVKVIEPSRRVLKFRVKGDLSKLLYGVPMAKIGDNAFLFKFKDGSLKKVYLRDIIVENQRASNRAKMVFEEYEFEDEPRGDTLEQVKSEAKRISRKEGVVQHVNEKRPGVYEISDWYDDDTTVASYENGMEL